MMAPIGNTSINLDNRPAQQFCF